jgi:MFS family permease
VPIFVASSLLIVFAPELSRALGIPGAPVTASPCVLAYYLGMAVGDGLSGWLSQRLRSRKAAIAVFLGMLAASLAAYLSCREVIPRLFFLVCFLTGISTGYWAVLLTTATEMFGTNLRATVTTSVSNVIRGATVPITLGFRVLAPHGLVRAVALIGVVSLGAAGVSLLALPETFSRSLRYRER